VTVTNNSTTTGRQRFLAYADVIRFVGEQNQAISSTPVMANVNITGKGLTQVVGRCGRERHLPLSRFDRQRRRHHDGVLELSKHQDINGNDPNQGRRIGPWRRKAKRFQLSSGPDSDGEPTYDAALDRHLFICRHDERARVLHQHGRSRRLPDGESHRRNEPGVLDLSSNLAYHESPAVPNSNLGAFVGSIASANR